MAIVKIHTFAFIATFGQLFLNNKAKRKNRIRSNKCKYLS